MSMIKTGNPVLFFYEGIIMNGYRDRLMQLIANSGKQYKQIESDLSLPRNSIYDWKNGNTQSYSKYTIKLAEYFNVSTSYLLGTDSTKKDSPKTWMLSQEEEYMIKIFRALPVKEREHYLWLFESSAAKYIDESELSPRQNQIAINAIDKAMEKQENLQKGCQGNQGV